MLNSSFNRAEKFEKSAFLGSLTYALCCEVCRSLISEWYVVSRAHKLPPCFTQNARFCVHKQVYFLSFERSELEGKYAPIVLGRHSSTSTVSA